MKLANLSAEFSIFGSSLVSILERKRGPDVGRDTTLKEVVAGQELPRSGLLTKDDGEDSGLPLDRRLPFAGLRPLLGFIDGDQLPRLGKCQRLSSFDGGDSDLYRRESNSPGVGAWGF